MIWKDVKGYEGIYKISEYGTIKSLERITIGKTGRINKAKERIMKPFFSRGYVRYVLSKNGESKKFSAHQLVASNFYISGNGDQINHLDGNKSNNHYYNLQWCTSKENNHHATKIGLCDNSGENNPNSKLSNSDVVTILMLYGNGYNQSEISRMYGVRPYTIGRIVNKVNWIKITKHEPQPTDTI